MSEQETYPMGYHSFAPSELSEVKVGRKRVTIVASDGSSMWLEPYPSNRAETMEQAKALKAAVEAHDREQEDTTND